jgi:dsDNA-binding SOS-regulon protein
MRHKQRCPNPPVNAQMYQVIDKINTILNKTDNFLSTCQVGQPCYIKELEDVYNKAKADSLSCQDNVSIARKNYITARDGENEMDRITKEEAYQKAHDEVLKLIEEYVDILRMVYTQTEALDTAEEGSSYMDGVLIQTIANNALSEQHVKKSLNEILTNDRKSYYEQDKYTNLKWWNRIWFWSYLFLWITFSLLLFFTNNRYSYLSVMSKAGFILLFLIYMFIAKYIVLIIISFIVFCTTLFPKNVYLQM